MNDMRSRGKVGRWLVAALLLSLVLLLTGGPAAWADGIYSARIYSPAHPRYSYTVRFDTIDDLFAKVEVDPPANHIPGLDVDNDPIKADANYGGALVTVDIPAGSTDVIIEAPALGISETFSGEDRVLAVVEAQTFVEEDPEGAVASMDEYVAQANPASAADDGGSSDCFISSLF